MTDYKWYCVVIRSEQYSKNLNMQMQFRACMKHYLPCIYLNTIHLLEHGQRVYWPFGNVIPVPAPSQFTEDFMKTLIGDAIKLSLRDIRKDWKCLIVPLSPADAIHAFLDVDPALVKG